MVFLLSHTSQLRRARWFGRTAAAAAIAVCLITASGCPAVAAPAAPTPGPAGGSTPVPDGVLDFPTAPAPIASAPDDAGGPLATEIINAASAAERLGEQLKAIDDELVAAREITAGYRATWDESTVALEALRQKAAEVAAEAYKRATELGPFNAYANDLQNLGLLVPALPAQHEQAQRPQQRDTIGHDAAEAEKAEQAAKADYDAALAAEQEISGRRAVIDEQFSRHTAALNTLRTRNAAALTQLLASRDAYEAAQVAGRGLGSSVNGLKAGPLATRAVTFALSQVGKMYEWAAEGPYTYDCSGLMLAAYRSVGINLPRVSRDQYRYSRGTPVLASQLLPGDLIFFSTDRSDWRQIHHVGMYVGNGQMVHAPNVGQRVQVSTVWSGGYFGAIRVDSAVPAPGVTPSATASATPTPTQTTPPPTTPPPTTPPPTTPPPTTPPSTTPPPTTPPPTTAVPTTTAPTTPPAEQTTPPAQQTTPPAGSTGTASASAVPSSPASSLPPAVASNSSQVSAGRRRRRW